MEQSATGSIAGENLLDELATDALRLSREIMDKPLFWTQREQDTLGLDDHLSALTINALRRAKIFFTGQLVQKKASELLKIRTFGLKGLRAIEWALEEKGLVLGCTYPGWQPPNGGAEPEWIKWPQPKRRRYRR